MKVSTRIFLLSGVLSVLLVLISLFGLNNVVHTNHGMKNIYQNRLIPLVKLYEIIEHLSQIRTLIAYSMTEDDAQEVKVILNEKLPKHQAGIETAWQEFLKTEMIPTEKNLANRVETALKNYQVAREQTIVFIQAQNKQAAHDNFKQVATPVFQDLQNALEELLKLQVTSSHAEYTQATDDYVTLRNVNILIIFIGVGFGLMMTTWTIRTIRGDLGGEPAEAAAITAQIAQGELNVKIHTVYPNSLLGSMQIMQTNLNKIVKQIVQNVGNVFYALQDLSSAAKQVEAGSFAQSEAAAGIASSIEEITSSVNMLYERAENAQDTSQKSDNLANHGYQIIHTAIDKIQQMTQVVEQASRTIQNLDQKSEEITTIVNVIRDVAEQTNLLALNAAIEAARAGEQGRGFAVVADEVRKLAERTANATGEISTMITGIQESAGSALECMQSVVFQVTESTQIAHEAGDAIQQIREGSVEVVRAVTDISDALREQTQATQDISTRVEKVAAMTEENHATVQQMNHAVTAIDSLTQTMKQEVTIFKT